MILLWVTAAARPFFPFLTASLQEKRKHFFTEVIPSLSRWIHAFSSISLQELFSSYGKQRQQQMKPSWSYKRIWKKKKKWWNSNSAASASLCVASQEQSTVDCSWGSTLLKKYNTIFFCPKSFHYFERTKNANVFERRIKPYFCLKTNSIFKSLFSNGQNQLFFILCDLCKLFRHRCVLFLLF